MADFDQPVSATDSRYGWPLHRRAEEFEKRKSGRDLPTHRVPFEGKYEDFPIIRVPINLPKYRLANGRTVSSQEEFLAQNPAVRQDLFSGDPELLDAQEVQHRLLLAMAKEAELQDYFRDVANQQGEPLVLDEVGFVLNGNRRLATWRSLIADDPSKFGHFANIDVVVLPHCDEKEIDRIEAIFQVKKDIRANYSWDTQANMIVQKRDRYGYSDKQLADMYGMTESEVRERLDMLAYATDYLRSRGKEHRWSLVADKEFAFRQLVKRRSRVGSVGEQELFKQGAFTLIDKSGEAGRRLYEQIPSIQEFLTPIKTALQAEFAVEPTSSDEGLAGLFGGTPTTANPIDIPLAAAIQKPENADRAREIIVDVIDSQRQHKKDAKAANFLVASLAKANTELAAAVRDGLRAESSTAGVQAQLVEIRKHLERIEKWLSSRA